MNKYTEAIQGDDVVILCDGIPMGVGEILAALNAATPPADAALADFLNECAIDMDIAGMSFITLQVDRDTYAKAKAAAALRARAVPGEPPEWPEYHEHGMGCGIEDRGITDRYEACRYGFEEAVERCVEAFDNWLAASKGGE